MCPNNRICQQMIVVNDQFSSSISLRGRGGRIIWRFSGAQHLGDMASEESDSL